MEKDSLVKFNRQYFSVFQDIRKYQSSSFLLMASVIRGPNIS